MSAEYTCNLTYHKDQKTPYIVAPGEITTVHNNVMLKSKLNEIHRYIGNSKIGYGMNALKMFNVIYALKKIEEAGVIDNIKLKRPECEFSYLLKLANDYEEEKLVDVVLNETLQSLYESELNELLFHEIPKNIRASVLARLVKEVNKITIIEKTCNVLLSGKTYEYFIGRDKTAISELGAYFTDRHIVEYILNKLDPGMNDDGTIPTMIDMFGGSGGFTTGYINYLNEKYPKMINWVTELSKVSHYDINEDVVKFAALEFFCSTGVFPTTDNIRYTNSFHDDFSNKKYKYVITNPPYGGNKTAKSTAQINREKIRDFIKEELLTITDPELIDRRQMQLKNIDDYERLEKRENDDAKIIVPSCSKRIIEFAHTNEQLKGNDKESCSLMLLMDIVEPGGTAIGILKEEVFFSEIYKDLRRVLIEKYNVREVISIPQDHFETTTTKTSILIFDNTDEKTTEVKFRDIVVERYIKDKFVEVDGNIVVIEHKDDIKEVNDILISTSTKDELLANDNYSLVSKYYNRAMRFNKL